MKNERVGLADSMCKFSQLGLSRLCSASRARNVSFRDAETLSHPEFLAGAVTEGSASQERSACGLGRLTRGHNAPSFPPSRESRDLRFTFLGSPSAEGPGTTMVARRGDRPRQIRDGSCILSPGARADSHFYSRSLGVHRGLILPARWSSYPNNACLISAVSRITQGARASSPRALRSR